MPPGWTASDEGYYLNAEALSNLTAAAKTYRLERDAWEKSYRDLSERSKAYGQTVQAQLAALREEINAENAVWGKKVRKARSPGLGVFAGLGHDGDAVVGIGAVWRVF